LIGNMNSVKIIETARLILRPWIGADAEVLAKINQDKKVIEFLPGAMSLEEAKNFIDKINNHITKHGFGLWAAELKDGGELIGFIGLNIPDFQSHFTPCVEIGWRLSSKYWGKGYATEGAKAALKFGFEKLKLKEIVAFTVPKNLRSIAVMERLGMKRDLSGDFNHPKLSFDHDLSRHILYRLASNLTFKS
jgi:RimJ/RimL family protein N-acetyltransferase